MIGYTLSFVFQDEILYHYEEQVLLWKANNSIEVCKQNDNGLWVYRVEVISKGKITNSYSEFASNPNGTNTFEKTPKAAERPNMAMGKYSFSLKNSRGRISRRVRQSPKFPMRNAAGMEREIKIKFSCHRIPEDLDIL
jgi:hypothetical protein